MIYALAYLYVAGGTLWVQRLLDGDPPLGSAGQLVAWLTAPLWPVLFIIEYAVLFRTWLQRRHRL